MLLIVGAYQNYTLNLTWTIIKYPRRAWNKVVVLETYLTCSAHIQLKITTKVVGESLGDTLVKVIQKSS